MNPNENRESSRITLDAMEPSDWAEVRSIFEEGIATGLATFETEAPDWPEWDTAHLPDCRIVARDAAGVAGWAAVSPVSERCVYGGVAEVSVYVAARARGRGVGRELLGRLVRDSERAGIWTLQAGIFPENTPSLKIHENCGFRRVGVRERLGRMNETWLDVVLLERRSPSV